MARLRASAPLRPAPASRAAAVRPQALFGGLFGGGGKKSADASAEPAVKVCVDCGWLVFEEDFTRGMKCPVCTSKNFKNFKGAVKGKRLDNSPRAMKARFQAREW